MKIDVYHDIACPWCRIGKANLETALTEWSGEPVTVNWQPFLLDHDVPNDGVSVSEFYKAKFGAENLDSMFDRVRTAGRNAGVEFNFERGIRAPSINAHRLIWLAPEEAKRAVVEGLHRAYFNDGQNVADLQTLADIAAAAGMDRAETLARLNSEEGKSETIAGINRGVQLGISGVPFFVLDDTFALSGAQPPATLLSAMQQTVAARQQA